MAAGTRLGNCLEVKDDVAIGPAALLPTAPPANHPRADLDLLTPDDICALLKVKKSWLYGHGESGAVEARLGKQLRFRPSAVARYLDASAGRQ